MWENFWDAFIYFPDDPFKIELFSYTKIKNINLANACYENNAIHNL